MRTWLRLSPLFCSLGLVLGLGALLMWGSMAQGEPLTVQTSEVYTQNLRGLPPTQPVSPCVYLPLITRSVPPVALLELSADPTRIPVGGATSLLRAEVEDEQGHPIADGTVVTFTTDLGSVGSTVVTQTTASGVATATLTSGEVVGTATVIATADSKFATTTVQFTPGPLHTVTLSADPTSIPADGISTSTVTALLKDAYSNPLSGVTAIFTTTLGTLSHPMRTSDAGGAASVVLTSAITPGVSTISAAADSITHTAEVTFTISPIPEVRGLWVTRWDYIQPEDVVRIVERAAYAHFNTLFFQVRGQADAYYQSQYEPWAARLTGSVTETLGQDPGWDPLQTALDEARARGLQLHAWINAYPVWVTSQEGHFPPEGTTPPHLFWTLSHTYGWDKWRQWDESGPMLLIDYPEFSYLWVSPAVTLTVEHLISVCQDIVTHYEVDGLHLDYIRYAGPEFSHDPISEVLFTATHAISPTITWEEWQRDQVTQLVDRIYREVILPRPEVMLSAAVWPIYQDRWGWIEHDGYEGYYQDSQGWMQGGHIDGLAPMLYAHQGCMGGEEYPSRFYTLAQDFVAHGNGRLVLPGIYGGTDAGMSHYDDFEDIAASIDLARQAGAAGQAIFSYRLIEERDYWDDFREGPYQQPAMLPAMEWREGEGVTRDE